MQDLVREAMAAGAVGLATSQSSGHVGEAGRPVPSRQARREELSALAVAMAEGGRGIVEITPHSFPISTEELAALQGLARRTGRPVSFSAILDLPERAGVWEPVFEQLRAGMRRGAVVVPQVSCRPMRFDFDLETGCASLDALPCWRRFRAAASHAHRLALLADPEFRAALRAQALGRAEAPSSRRWQTVILDDTACGADQRFIGQPLAEIAAARGGDVIDALLDVAAADDLRARFSLLLLNYDDERVGHLLRQPESLIALSDAGAHVSVLCDAGYTTYFLGHWVRERQLFSWEEAVHRLTGMPAALYGIPRRGRLAPGFAADLTCFDPEHVAMLPPERVCDFPAGVSRYVARSTGIEHVFLAGQELMARGEWTGAHPGTLLRS
jgi:N-acyl-D-amino-acid deacylase